MDLLGAIKRAWERITTGIKTPGGWLTSPRESLTASILGPFVGLLGGRVTPEKKIELAPRAYTEPSQPPTLPAVGFQRAPDISSPFVILGPYLSPVTSPVTTTTTTPTKTTTTSPTTPITTPTTPKAEIATAKPAPAPAPTPPPPTPPAVAGGATRAITPPPTAGFEAPRLASLPPAPTPIAERGAFVGAPPTIPETPLGQFEAMIRALQQLTQARYLPRPLEGALAFGPAGALERALKRLRERELGISPT